MYDILCSNPFISNHSIKIKPYSLFNRNFLFPPLKKKKKIVSFFIFQTIYFYIIFDLFLLHYVYYIIIIILLQIIKYYSPNGVLYMKHCFTATLASIAFPEEKRALILISLHIWD